MSTNGREDGGPAFPSAFFIRQLDGGLIPSEYDGEAGMSVRKYFAVHAPAQEIEGMTPMSVADCETFLGIPAGTYNTTVHYPMICARARFAWADAMLQASQAKI